MGTAFSDDKSISQENIEKQDNNGGIYYKNPYANTDSDCREYKELIDAKLKRTIGKYYEVGSDMYNAMYEWLYHDDKECLKACCEPGYKPNISDLSYISYLDTCDRMAYTCCCDRPELSCKYYYCLSEQNEPQNYGSIVPNEEIVGTYIFYINGMNTSEDAADEDLEFIKKQYEQVFKKYHSDETIKFELIYNETLGLANDLQEVILQKDLEYTNNTNLFTSIILTKNPKPTGDLLPWQKFRGHPYSDKVINSLYETDRVGVKKILYALKSGARVILIAHSQGNLFANDLANSFFHTFPEELKDSMGVVSIATPANRTVTKSEYCAGNEKAHYCYATDRNDSVIAMLDKCLDLNNLNLDYDTLPPTVDNKNGLIELLNYAEFEGSCFGNTLNSTIPESVLSILRQNRGHNLQKDYLTKGLASEILIEINLGFLYRDLKHPSEETIKKANELYNKLFSAK